MTISFLWKLESRAGGRAQTPVHCDCQRRHTTPVEQATSKSAGGEHVPPTGELGWLQVLLGHQHWQGVNT